MWCSCLVPSLHSLWAISEFLEGSQSSDFCLSLQTAPKNGSGRESWMSEQRSKTAQHHTGVHTSTESGWVLCFHSCFSRQGLRKPPRRARTLTVKENICSSLPLPHLFFFFFTKKKSWDLFGASAIPDQLQSEDTEWEKLSTAGSRWSLTIFCHRQPLGVSIAGHKTEHSRPWPDTVISWSVLREGNRKHIPWTGAGPASQAVSNVGPAKALGYFHPLSFPFCQL